MFFKIERHHIIYYIVELCKTIEAYTTFFLLTLGMQGAIIYTIY